MHRATARRFCPPLPKLVQQRFHRSLIYSSVVQVMAQQRAFAPAGLRLVQHLPASNLLAFSTNNGSLRHIEVPCVQGLRTRDVRGKAEEPKQAEKAKAPPPIENDPVRRVLTTSGGGKHCMPSASTDSILMIWAPTRFQPEARVWSQLICHILYIRYECISQPCTYGAGTRIRSAKESKRDRGASGSRKVHEGGNRGS